MSQKIIFFKIIDSKPTIPKNNDYKYLILSYDTQLKNFIYCNTNNQIIDKTNLNKSLKYIVKIMKRDKILGVGNLIINQDIFQKKIKRKIYNNINIFMSEKNYKKIYNKVGENKLNQGIIVSIEINVKYNEIAKDMKKKIKLVKRNLSFQKNEYSVKSTNNYLTTTTSNVNTYNNANSRYDSDNFSETNINYFSPDKLGKNNTPSISFSPLNFSSPFSEPSHKNKKKKRIKKELFNSISFKNKGEKTNNIFPNNIKYNINDLKNRIKLCSSRNKKFLFNKNKINMITSNESSSSKTSNTFSNSSVIDSALIETDNNNYNLIINNKIKENKNSTNDTFVYNSINKYNSDTDEIDNYLIELEKKKNKLLKEKEKINKQLFNQDIIYNNLKKAFKKYESKIKNKKFIINKIKEKNELLKYKKEIIIEINKEIIPIISKIKESKLIENNIINLILNNNENNEELNDNNMNGNNIQKYNKNLIIKMLKNLIQSNHDVDLYLNDEYKNKLRNICNKYNIFGSIIEEMDDE